MATFGNLETGVEPLAGLMRDHGYVYSLVEAAEDAIHAALAAGGDPERAEEALERVRDLDAYLAVDLVVHIAKEERVLFPALRGLAAGLNQVVDEMVEQHNEVRARGAAIEAALAALDAAHERVEAATADFSGLVAGANAGGTGTGSLPGILDAVKRLSWILQGHFGDEEDDLFAPALELLPAERWPELARAATALEV